MNNDYENRRILVTGASGMIGSAVVRTLLEKGFSVIGVDKKLSELEHLNYKHYDCDLMDSTLLHQIIETNDIQRVVHLAALAHSDNNPSWEDYYSSNVECSKNVFEAAQHIPVLFISTIDVYGFSMSCVDENSECKPVSDYGKTKLLAENECKKLESYTIFRLAPVYSDTIKRDIQKRYYLKYPTIAYSIGAGAEFEVLSIHLVSNEIVNWCKTEQLNNGVRIVKDKCRLKTKDAIKAEKDAGRATFVIHVPRTIVVIMYHILMKISGETPFTYLLSKAVYPLRSEN